MQTSQRRSGPANTAQAVETGLLDKLLLIAKASRALLGVRLAEIGLNPGQDQMIVLLEREVRCKVGAVADALNVRPSTVSKMADRLRAMGLIDKETIELDARCTELSLTDAGKAKKIEVLACWQELELQLVDANPQLADPRLRESLELIESVLKSRLSRLR